MEPKYFDIHAHLNFPDYDVDRAVVIARTREAGVLVNNVGTDLKTSEEVLKLAEENSGFYATIGVHPTEWAEGFTEVKLRELAQHPKTIAIGECGLDYFRITDESEKSKQKELFEKHIMLAEGVGKPLMLHIRDAKDAPGQAYLDILEILKAHPQVKAHSHFFAGDWVLAQKFLEWGVTLSFTGVITFARQYDEVIKNIPLDMLMAETDAPFVAPVPYRGKRAEPLHVREVVAKIAEIRGMELETVQKALLDNACRRFVIPT